MIIDQYFYYIMGAWALPIVLLSLITLSALYTHHKRSQALKEQNERLKH